MADHVHMMLIDTAKVFGVRGGGVYQGEERDSDRPTVYGSGEEFCRAEFLGEGILRVDGGAGRGRKCAIYIREQEKEDRRLDQLKMFE